MLIHTQDLGPEISYSGKLHVIGYIMYFLYCPYPQLIPGSRPNSYNIVIKSQYSSLNVGNYLCITQKQMVKFRFRGTVPVCVILTESIADGMRLSKLKYYRAKLKIEMCGWGQVICTAALQIVNQNNVGHSQTESSSISFFNISD